MCSCAWYLNWGGKYYLSQEYCVLPFGSGSYSYGKSNLAWKIC